MEDTAAGADQEGSESEVGRGEMRRWRALYARAEVDEVVLWRRLGGQLKKV